MIPRAHVTAWRSRAPWPEDYQIEQDLVIARALVELYSEPMIRDGLALRGGTAIYRLANRAARYSEDIDLVQQDKGPIGPLLDAARACLDPWLGPPRRTRGPDSFDSESIPVRRLRLKVEINTRDHFTVLEPRRERFEIDSPWFRGVAEVLVYEPDELYASKLRALYQRKKGRDLFDLASALQLGLVDPTRVMECFVRYMEGEPPVTRAQFERNLMGKASDRAFLEEVRPLLATGTVYDPTQAIETVLKELISHLPGEPWRGVPGT